MFVIIVERLIGCQSLVENDGLVLNAVRGKREGVSVLFLRLQTALSVWVQSTTAVGFAMDKGAGWNVKGDATSAWAQQVWWSSAPG